MLTTNRYPRRAAHLSVDTMGVNFTGECVHPPMPQEFEKTKELGFRKNVTVN